MNKKDEYGLKYWAKGTFVIEKSVVRVNKDSKPSLLEIVEKAQNEYKLNGPILMRFPHLIDKQMKRLHKIFKDAIKNAEYQGKFQAVFPLKVNQFKTFVESFEKYAQNYNYGLEAGSKAELLLAIFSNSHKAPITVNGFKGKEMIELGFLAKKIGHDITLTIEGFNELEQIIAVANKHKREHIPKIGIRMRLHSIGTGRWAKSGGFDSKFGLTATELIHAFNLLKQEGLLHKFRMLHFHIGSQINSVLSVQKAIKESGQIYAELKRMGADNLDTINIGGGIAVEYAQHKHKRDKNYALEEFAYHVVTLFKRISEEKEVDVPNIMTESGRFISASHAVMILPVLELFSEDHTEKNLMLKNNNPQIVTSLNKIFQSLKKENANQSLHDTLDLLDSVETLFEMGYLDLQDRGNIEILSNLIIKKVLYIVSKEDLIEYNSLLHKLEERYLINASMFQAIPDYWGLEQKFPIMPIHKLDQKPLRPASIWDITCDSDGEIDFDEKAPIFLHDVDLDTENYYLGLFLVGAYQEILGMKHNLFAKAHEIVVEINKKGFEISQVEESCSLLEILESVGYSENNISNKISSQIHTIKELSTQDKILLFEEFKKYFSQNNYLESF
jgi:arginine decarboxylase